MRRSNEANERRHGRLMTGLRHLLAVRWPRFAASDKNVRLSRLCRVAAVECSRGFQPTVLASSEFRVASATPESGVADATQNDCRAFPALKRRAKIRSPLRGCKIAALHLHHYHFVFASV